MNEVTFSGVGPALVTPFLDSGELDLNGLENLVNYVSDGGVNFLVVLGTTGESPNVSSSERLQIIETVKKSNRKGLPIMLGLGGNSTLTVLEQVKQTNFEGIDGILSVSPYYNKPSQPGIIRHFELIADACPVPVTLYNVPSRTSSNMSASSVAQLSRHDNISGIKEASGDMMQVIKIREAAEPNFNILSGDDMLTLPMLGMGASGVISVLGNGFPESFSKMIHLGLQGDFKRAYDLSDKFLALNDLMYVESNPVGIKEVLKQKGVCGANVRLPLLPSTQALSKKILEEIKKAAF